MEYLPSKKASEVLGLHPNTLRKYASSRKIGFIRNSNGQRQYNVNSYVSNAAHKALINKYLHD